MVLLGAGCIKPAQNQPVEIEQAQETVEDTTETATVTLANEISAAGFTDVNSNIINEQNFPTAGPAAPVSDMTALSDTDLGGSDMTTSEIESAIERMGYRSATLIDLLAYAKAKWNGKDWIVALGSPWMYSEGSDMPSIYGEADKRVLSVYLATPDSRWGPDTLFLVVRK